MNVFVDEETLEKLSQCIPDGDTYEEKFKQICDSFSQMYEVSADAIKVIDNLEESNANLHATLKKTGSLSVASMRELELQIQENENLRQRLTESLASPKLSAPATPSTESNDSMKQVLEWIAEFFGCTIEELDSIVPRVATEHKNYQDLINRICEKLQCREDEIEDVLDARPDLKKQLQCETDDDLRNRIELMKNCTGLVESLSSMLGVPAEDLHQTVMSLMAAPKAGADVDELKKEIEKLKEQGRAVATERDELLHRISVTEALNQHRELAYDHYSSVFERFPVPVASGDAPPISDASLWNMTYELRNAHESIREMQRVNDEEKKRLENELAEAGTEAIKEQTQRQTLEAENALLRSQLSSSESNQQLQKVCESLGCATQAEVQQKITSMKTEILFLRSQKQVNALLSKESFARDNSGEQLARLISENDMLKDELAGTKTELYKSQQEVESVRSSIERARRELMEKDQILSSERNQRREAEIARESAKSDLRLATKELDEIRSQCEAVVTAANRITAAVEHYGQRNRNAAELCKSLNMTMCQFSLLEFATDPSRELLTALTKTSVARGPSLESPMVEDMVSRFSQKVHGTINDISRKSKALASRITATEHKFARLKETTLDLIDLLQEKKEELHNFMDSDMAPLAMSLQVQLQKLQENQQPQVMTPPRSQFNSRSSMSPSEVVLETGPRSRFSDF